MPALTDAQKEDIQQYFEGSSHTLQDYLQHEPDMTEEQVEDALLEYEVEQCSTCGWWAHQSELESVDGEPTCDDCREDDEDA